MSAHNPLTTTVSSKGQIVLPRSVRQSRHWEPGTKLIVENTRDGVLLRPAPVLKETSVDEVFGMLNWRGAPKTLDDMDAGVLAEAKRQHEGD